MKPPEPRRPARPVRQRLRERNIYLYRLLHGRDPETGERWVWIDQRVAAHPGRFLIQAALASGAMLVLLLMVDSLSNAAIAAGLASSVAVIFINPSNRTARIRCVVGGHLLALLLGSAVSLALGTAGLSGLLEGTPAARIAAYALLMGLTILLMTMLNAEHPPATGTAIGMAIRPWEPEIFGSILGAVIVLAIIKLLLRTRIRDLT